jgi:FixJ family two-component response regulator
MRDHGVPIVFLTGYDRGVIPAEFEDARCLQKPVRERDLIGAVSSAGVRPAED